MNRLEQITRSVRILSGWKHSAVKAIANGDSSVTLATIRLKSPTGSHTKLCQTCGPMGSILDITPTNGRVVIVAKYSAEAVASFCAKQLQLVTI